MPPADPIADRAPSAVPRPAASVIVLRPAPGPPEVLLLRRHGRSGFAAGAWVFPGGTVDALDEQLPDAAWQGIDPAALASRFDATPPQVLGFHVAAVRELFEEAGVLLASDRAGRPAPAEDPDAQRLRVRLTRREAGAGEFAAWVTSAGLRLELGALTYHSRWVTPRAEPRRYDTAFFVAALPAGQVAAHDRGETTGQRWLTAADALTLHRAGDLHLIYPTIRTLESLARFTSAQALVDSAARQPAVRSILPHLQVDAGGGARLIHPDEPDYPRHLYDRQPPGRREASR